MQAQSEEEVYSSYSFLTLALISVTPRPRFTPEERIPGNHCIGGWVGLRAGLEAEARGKFLCLCRGSDPLVQFVVNTMLTELPQVHLHHN
jgi:hypothetical protein